MWPRLGSLVPGPTEPRTKRSRPSWANSAMASRASSAAPLLKAKASSPSPNSASVTGEVPKVLVSTASAPASR